MDASITLLLCHQLKQKSRTIFRDEKGIKPIIWNIQRRSDIYSFSEEETSCVKDTYRIGSSSS